MKNILFVVAMILAVPPAAIAEGPTPESSLRNGAQIVANARHYQKELCEQPRNGTGKQCRADFDYFVEVEIEHTARHVLYLVAKKRGGDAREIARLKGDSERMYAIIQKLANNLDRLYMPLPQPTTPTGQAPVHKPVSLNTK